MRFSVVVPTFNRRDLLVEALDSLLAQVRRPDQVVVVADGCTDGTGDLVRRSYPDFVLLEQDNAGIAVARNHAMTVADGDWVCFLDDDDTWAPDKLAELESYLVARPEARAVYHPVWLVQDGAVSGPVHTEDFEAKGTERLLLGVPSVPSALAVERGTMLRAGLFPTHVAYGEDWLFDVSVGRLVPWCLLPLPLATVRVHQARMSAPTSATRPTHFLAAPIGLWTGRPRPELLAGLSSRYRSMYRPLMQRTLAERRWQEAAELNRWLRVLLPRHRDRLYLVVPERVLKLLRRLTTGRTPPAA